MNGKKFNLDTNIVIALFGEDKNVIRNIEKSLVFIPIIVLGELYYGAELSSRKTENLKKLDAFSRSCDIIYFTHNTATIYGRVKSSLKKSGTPIPENDIWIAALTLENNLTIVSRDQHFDLIKGLKCARW